MAEAGFRSTAGGPPVDDPRPDGLRAAPSLVLVNTGDGKGKSSAAFGVMARAVARGWTVVVIQFVKSGGWQVGEQAVAERLGVEWHAVGDGFTWDSSNLDQDIAHARNGWALADAVIASGRAQLVILDELTYICTWGWVPVDDVVAALRARPSHVNVIVTGRDAPQALIDVADTVTEMREVKHAYCAGYRAMRGIDY